MASAQKAPANITLPRAEYEALQEQLQSLTSQLDWFKRQLFGRKSEKRLDVDPTVQGNLLSALGVATPPRKEAPTETVTLTIDGELYFRIVVLLAVIGVLSTFFTLVMSNVGATVLLVPLAVNIAIGAGADPAGRGGPRAPRPGGHREVQRLRRRARARHGQEPLLRRDDLAQIPWPIERRPLSGRFGTLRVLTFPPPGAGRKRNPRPVARERAL